MLGFKLGIVHGGIHGAQRGARQAVPPAPVPLRGPVLPAEHNALPRMRIRSQLFQSLQDCGRVFHPGRGRERNLIVLLLPVQLIRQGTLFQTDKTTSICAGPYASIPQYQKRRHINVFQSLPDSPAHRHPFGIQHVHPLRPVADENILSLPEDGRHEVFRQHFGISLTRNGRLPRSGTIQITILLGIIPAAQETPGADAVAVRQAGPGAYQYLVFFRTGQNIADIGRQPVPIRLVRLPGKLLAVPVPRRLHVLPLHVPRLAR